MANYHETLVRRFWSHVFEKPDKTAVLVKNMAPSESTVFAGPSPSALPVIVRTTPKPYRALHWSDSGHIVAELMAFLHKNGFKKGDRAAILSWNCPEWVWIDLAVQSLGGVTVPIYPNTSSEGACDILNDCGAKFLFADDDEQLAKADDSLLQGALQHKVLFAEAMKDVPDYTGSTASPDAAYGNHQVLEFSAASRRWFDTIAYEFKNYGRFDRVDLNSIATIIYTSGSTGRQKGAILTHGNIASACEALIRHGFDFSDSDVYLSYLPLAHVYERVNGQAMCIWNAVPTAFCRVDELGEALKVVRPTILVGVPAVWRKIKDKISAELATATGAKAKLIKLAFDPRTTHVTALEQALINWAASIKNPSLKKALSSAACEMIARHKVGTPLLNRIARKIVSKKIRAGVGGNLRLIMSGGAAIDPDVISFFNLVGLNLRQGYGLTETSGGIAAETPANNRIGSVGKLIDCVAIKFVENTENPDPKKQIIFLRGDSIFQGYNNLPEANAKSFDADGWFDTGDLGWMDADGYLYITGRKKRQGKTEGGKYYSPEKIENAFDGSPLVQYVVPTGDGKPFIGALIFVNQLEAQSLLAKSNVVATGDAAAFYATHAIIAKAIAEAVSNANKKLEHWESVGQYEIVPSEASVANGLLTPTLKIRTERVLQKYSALVDLIYSRKR